MATFTRHKSGPPIPPLCRGDTLYFRFTESASTSSLPTSLASTPDFNEHKKARNKSRGSAWNLREMLQKSHKHKNRRRLRSEQFTDDSQSESVITTPTLSHGKMNPLRSHSSTGTVLSDADFSPPGKNYRMFKKFTQIWIYLDVILRFLMPCLRIATMAINPSSQLMTRI